MLLPWIPQRRIKNVRCERTDTEAAEKERDEGLPIMAVLKTGMFAGLLLLLATAASGYSRAPDAKLNGIVKDPKWAQVLGEALFWETVSELQAPGEKPTEVAQVTQALLSHRAPEKYMWLIRQAFDESLWRGSGYSQVERNFPLIWKVSIGLYEQTLDPISSPGPGADSEPLGGSDARADSDTPPLRVCQPNGREDEFDCTNELAPTRMVPIPQPGYVLGLQTEPTIG